jgi:hypothetical protein
MKRGGWSNVWQFPARHTGCESTLLGRQRQRQDCVIADRKRGGNGSVVINESESESVASRRIYRSDVPASPHLARKYSVLRSENCRGCFRVQWEKLSMDTLIHEVSNGHVVFARKFVVLRSFLVLA